jgi:hypothetical protein
VMHPQFLIISRKHGVHCNVKNISRVRFKVEKL